MKTTITLTAMALFFIINTAFSQPTKEWEARYNNGGTDQLYDMAVDASGNVYVTGSSIQGSPTSDYLTIKYNSSGVKQWEKKYNGIADSQDRAYAITVDASGNVYVTGGTGYDNSIVTIKYNTLGDSLWTRSYMGPTSGHNWTYPTSIVVDDSGYVYIAGTSEGTSGIHGLFQDYTTIKYSPLGVQQWVARHNGAGTDADVVNSIAVDATGNVYVTGYSGGGSTGSSDSYNDITTIKYNSSGIILWKKTYAGPGTSSDESRQVILDKLGNVYITGKTYSGTSANDDIITIKYDAIGTEIWAKSFNGPGNGTDEGIALTVDARHNVYVTGRSDYGSGNGFDIVTLRYDSTSTQRWAKYFNGSANGNDAARDIAMDNDGKIYILGTTVNTTTAEDFQVIKYDSSGTQLWETRYTNSNGPGNQEYAVTLRLDKAHNIYAAGMSTLDYAVIKYSQLTGIHEVPGQLAACIFPNPSGGRFTIKMENTTAGVIEIYNASGEKIYSASTVVQQRVSEIDLISHSKGMYFIKIIAGNTMYFEKIVIQ